MPGANAASGPALASPAPSAGTAASPGRWGDLGPRLLSAAVLIGLALFCLWLGGLAWWLAVAAGGVVLAVEWAGLSRVGEQGARQAVRVALAASLLSALAVLDAPVAAPMLVLVCLLVGVGVTYGLSRSGFAAAGVPYLGLGVLAVALLRRDPATGLLNTLALLLVVWASDTGAFVAGRLLGGPRLAPAISPGKTWTGAAGGLLASTLVAVAVDALVAGHPPGHSWRAAATGAGLGVATQAGDLLESWIKRRAGVKDSGRLIPGHGGLLDRVDGLLTAAPLAALLSWRAGAGEVFWRW